MCVGEGEQEWRREINRRKHGGRGRERKYVGCMYGCEIPRKNIVISY